MMTLLTLAALGQDLAVPADEAPTMGDFAEGAVWFSERGPTYQVIDDGRIRFYATTSREGLRGELQGAIGIEVERDGKHAYTRLTIATAKAFREAVSVCIGETGVKVARSMPFQGDGRCHFQLKEKVELSVAYQDDRSGPVVNVSAFDFPRWATATLEGKEVGQLLEHLDATLADLDRVAAK